MYILTSTGKLLRFFGGQKGLTLHELPPDMFFIRAILKVSKIKDRKS